MRSQVKVNLTNENLIIKLNEEADQKEIIENLKKKAYITTEAFRVSNLIVTPLSLSSCAMLKHSAAFLANL